MFGVSLHKLVIHFPIALAVVAFLYDAWGAYSRELRFHSIGSGLLKLAAFSAIIAMGTGLELAGMSGMGSGSTVTGHAGIGIATTVILSALGLIRYSAEARSEVRRQAYSPIWLAVEGFAAVLVATTAVIGHSI